MQCEARVAYDSRPMKTGPHLWSSSHAIILVKPEHCPDAQAMWKHACIPDVEDEPWSMVDTTDVKVDTMDLN